MVRPKNVNSCNMKDRRLSGKSCSALGYFRRYSPPPPLPPHGRHWTSCNKCLVSSTRIPWISSKFCEFLPEFLENYSKFCKFLKLPKILNRQGLESCINCYCLSWKSWNFGVPNSVSSIGVYGYFLEWPHCLNNMFSKIKLLTINTLYYKDKTIGGTLCRYLVASYIWISPNMIQHGVDWSNSVSLYAFWLYW